MQSNTECSELVNTVVTAELQAGVGELRAAESGAPIIMHTLPSNDHYLVVQFMKIDFIVNTAYNPVVILENNQRIR